MSKLRTGKDFWSGIMFLGFAVLAIIVARGYSLGTPGKMGPGYFPIMLAVILGLLGLILVARAMLSGDEEVSRIKLVPLATMIVGVVLFGYTIQWLGLAISLMLTVAFAAAAGRESRPLEVVVMALALSVFSVTVFHYLLLLPLPIWPSF
jgi:putative tricarboxylic transport membrane protein